VKVVLVDDHRMLREGISWMLSSVPDIEVVGEASDGAGLLDLLATCDPDIVLLDLRMPGSSGFDVLAELRAKGGGPPVLVLTMYDDPLLIQDAVALGASGYILKSAGRDELIKAMRSVARGASYLQGELAVSLVRRIREGETGPSPLPADERDVLRLVAEGLGNREIGARLGLSESAVKKRLQSAYQHLGVRTRSSAVAAAIRLGLLE
jgi:DNA-binding NarL/FixJ family response regulator